MMAFALNTQRSRREALQSNKQVAAWQELLSGSNAQLPISARVFALEYSLPGGSVITRFLPSLPNFVSGNASNFHAIENRLSARPSIGPMKFSKSGCNDSIREYMHVALVIGEHSMPSLVIRAVCEEIFARVALPVVPTLYEQAFVQGEIDLARTAAGSAWVRDLPFSKPKVELPDIWIRGTGGCILRPHCWGY
jgi:hypothetical protein